MIELPVGLLLLSVALAVLLLWALFAEAQPPDDWDGGV